MVVIFGRYRDGRNLLTDGRCVVKRFADRWSVFCCQKVCWPMVGVLLSKGLLTATVVVVIFGRYRDGRNLLTEGRCVVKRFADRWSLCCQKVC